MYFRDVYNILSRLIFIKFSIVSELVSQAASIFWLSWRILIGFAAFLVCSCDTPEKTSLRGLARAGIQPSGRALVEAVAQDDKQHVAWLLTVKVHTEQRDSKGRTPLRIAVEENNPTTALLLLDAGADPNATGADGVDILGVALAENDSPVVEKLIASGAKANGIMPGGEKILPWAIRNGRLAHVRTMFRNGADPHLTDHAGNPLLHIAIDAGHRDLVKALIALGADPGATDPAGNSTIALALKNHWPEILPTLAAAGADANLPAPDGETLLEKAIKVRDFRTIPVLMQAGADPMRLPTTPGGKTPLEAAIASGHTATLRAVLRPGEILSGPEWEPALWLAFRQDNLGLARMLLKKGAHAQRYRSGGLLLTEAAALSGKVTWLKLLFDFGHKPGRAVFYSVSRGDYLTTKFLLDCRVSADSTLLPGFDSALSMAMLGGHDKLAALLIERGAKATLKLPGDQKPLHFAIVTKSPDLVRLLLEAGADPNEAISHPVSEKFLKNVKSKDMAWYLARDRNITPLMLAANSGVIASARYLLDAGAEKNTYTRVNYTWPLNFASRRSDVAMMRLLLGQDPATTERHVILSLGEQRVRVYNSAGDEILSARVSSGKIGYRTKQGEFVITNKYRHHNSSIYGSSMPYFQRLSCSDFGFHYGYVPGYPASHGCIRLPMDAAKKLFAITSVGDRVTIKP